MDYICDGWLWNKWEEIGDNKEIPSPKEDDHCKWRHGLKEGIREKFTTIFQFILEKYV